MPPIHELFGNNFLKIFFQTKSFAGLLLLFFRLIFSGLFRFSNKMFCFSYFECEIIIWGCSSVVEHSTADREVPGSNPGAPYTCVFVRNCTSITGCLLYSAISMTLSNSFSLVIFFENYFIWGCSSVVEHSTADREVLSSNLGAPSKCF